MPAILCVKAETSNLLNNSIVVDNGDDNNNIKGDAKSSMWDYMNE